MRPISFRKRFVALVVLMWPAYLAAAPDLSRCEPLSSDVDYHDVTDGASAVNLNTVESNHFVKDVEMLVRGQTAPLPLDIDFVLRAFPNHYRALNSMATWQLKNKLQTLTPDGRPWTADCYFQRALNFVPKDWRVRVVYAVYLHRAKRLDEAHEQYVAAEDLGANNADYYYSRGLLEVEMGDLDSARKYADKAYGMGMPLNGLRDKLARAEAKQRNDSAKR
jgi:tetratricopeptide (TPR) repeat protein